MSQPSPSSPALPVQELVRNLFESFATTIRGRGCGRAMPRSSSSNSTVANLRDCSERLEVIISEENPRSF
jgi:hypothetical protein